MAIVQLPYLARLVYRDNDGAEAPALAHLPVSAGAGAALSFAASWRPLVDAITSSTCIAVELVASWKETTPAIAGAMSDPRRQGLFIFETAAAGLASVRIPSLDQSLLLTTGPYAGIGIDLANPAVIAFVDLMTNGAGGAQPCDPFVNDLAALSQAYKEQF